MQDERKVKRSLMGLRKSAGSFTSRSIQTDSGVNHVCNRTIRRCLNRRGYYYLQSRKKGLLLKTDLTKRLKFCHKVRRLKITQQFWREGISFYLDGKGFEYKTNPQGAGRCPSAREFGGVLFAIPARSPDLNPIENFFHLVARRLQLQAVTKNIIRESFDEFSTRVINCIFNFSVQEINKIIDSMDKQTGLVISSKGQRIKY